LQFFTGDCCMSEVAMIRSISVIVLSLCASVAAAQESPIRNAAPADPSNWIHFSLDLSLVDMEPGDWNDVNLQSYETPPYLGVSFLTSGPVYGASLRGLNEDYTPWVIDEF
jgi:hypothetical protein